MAGVALKLGYNTNGFEGLALGDVIDRLGEIGYGSVAITLDQHALNPFGDALEDEARSVRQHLERWNMDCVVETGARFLLDPQRKHEPTLISDDADGRARRLAFLRRAVDVADMLGADVVSFWSGRKPDAMPGEHADQLLLDGCSALCDYALKRGTTLAFEPEPGMFIETLAQFERLRRRLDSPFFHLTLDVGHVHCLDDGGPAARIRQYRDILANVHIEDMRRGRHEHLMFGAGEMDFKPIIAALAEIRYTGGVHVELTRHAADGPTVARTAYRFLSRLIDEEQSWRMTT